MSATLAPVRPLKAAYGLTPNANSYISNAMCDVVKEERNNGSQENQHAEKNKDGNNMTDDQYVAVFQCLLLDYSDHPERD